MNSVTREMLLPVASAIRPVLNRIVFTGMEGCRELFDVAENRVRGAALRTVATKALATVPLDRIATELTAGGLVRSGRTTDEEKWTLPGGRHIAVCACATESPESLDAMIREYATLLVRTITLSPEITIQVSAPPVLLAVWWRHHETCSIPIIDSPHIEDILELVIRYSAVVEDVRGLPAELRAVVAHAASSLIAEDSCEWMIARALTDARGTPSAATPVVGRFRQIASMRTA